MIICPLDKVRLNGWMLIAWYKEMKTCVWV
jgi:hypothetical protein